MAKNYPYKCKACGINGYSHNGMQRYCYGCSYDKNVKGIARPDKFDDNGKRLPSFPCPKCGATVPVEPFSYHDSCVVCGWFNLYVPA